MNTTTHTVRRDARALPPARRAGAGEAESVRGLLPTVFLAGLVGLGVCLACGLILCLIAAAVLCAGSDPAANVGPCGLGAAALSCFIGGIASARKGGRAPLLCGLCCALLTVLCLAAGALCFKDGGGQALTLGLDGGIRAGLYAVAGLLCVVGALIGRRR